MITIVEQLYDERMVYMMKVEILVDAPAKDARGVKELIAMAMENVPGVWLVRVVGVQP